MMMPSSDLHHDRIVGGFDGRAEQAFADGSWSRAASVRRRSSTSCSSAAVFARISSIIRANARASTPVSPGASIGILMELSATEPLHRRSELPDRPGQRPRQQHGQYGGDQHRDEADRDGRFLDGDGRRHEDGVGHDADDSRPTPPRPGLRARSRCRSACRHCPARPGSHPASIRSDGCEIGEVVRQRVGVPSCEPNSRVRSGCTR